MQLSIMTRIRFQSAALLFLVTLFLNPAYENNCTIAAESTTPSPPGNSTVPTKKDGATKSSPVVVEVNGVKLTQNEVDTQINKTMELAKGKIPQDRVEGVKLDLRKKIIEDFITRTLLSQEIERLKIAVNESEIAQAVKEVEKELPQGMTLETALQQSGTNLGQLREEITFSLRANKLFDSQIKTDSPPTDEEVKNYYTTNQEQFGNPETVHARHILIKTNEQDDEKTKGEKKAKAETVRKQLVEGADFAKLAQEKSDCPSGKKGGDLGTFKRGMMVKPFEDAAFSQKVNEIGPLVTTPFGYHLIQVLEHTQATNKPLEEVKTEIQEALTNQKKQQMATNYLAELRKKAKIIDVTDEVSKK